MATRATGPVGYFLNNARKISAWINHREKAETQLEIINSDRIPQEAKNTPEPDRSVNLIPTITFVGIGAVVLVGLLFAPFSRTAIWRATVTPLASIIGSGFLVSAPLLAREFGGFAALAMALLILAAMLIGWTIRYNIRVVEPQLATDKDHVLHSIEQLSHIVLAFAYFISVSYYLALLGHFVLQGANIDRPELAKPIAISLLVVIGLLGWSGGAQKVARVERYATALNLSVIAGFLAALAVFAFGKIVGPGDFLSAAGKFELKSLPVLLGLLIVVQGFETTRFMGEEFDAQTRIKAMWNAQLVSGVIYVVFFILLSPLLIDLSQGEGVAAVISVSALVAGILPISLTIAATASQFSASVADSIGDAGLIGEITHDRVNPSHAYGLIALVGIGILWSTDVDQVIALASRAFALFYALQCLVAFEAARKRKGDEKNAVAFLALSIVSGAVFVFGVPAG
ncbi:hypothetical protein [Ruegeria atlantica]|uniref:hypothetical protein n=1 Tax=Ruegeria atlantica TaxID=81569 RepID=UPI0024940D0B|nr:hypothetical protein [Ruegeria atlantica]